MRSEEFLHGGNSTDSFDCQPIFNLHDNSTWWVVGSNCNSQSTKVTTIYIQWRSPNPSLLERNERLGRKEGSDARAAGRRDLGALFLEWSAGEKRCISILSLSSPFLICLNDVTTFNRSSFIGIVIHLKIEEKTLSFNCTYKKSVFFGILVENVQ